MSTRSRQEYFSNLRARFQKAQSKREMSQLIDEGVANTGAHRKSMIRTLHQKRGPSGEPARLGRPRKFSPASVTWLKRMCRASEYACSDKPTEMIPVFFAQWKGAVDPQIVQELQSMSPASMDRYLRKYRGLVRRRNNTGTRPGSRLFRQLIPIKAIGTAALRPG